MYIHDYGRTDSFYLVGLHDMPDECIFLVSFSGVTPYWT